MTFGASAQDVQTVLFGQNWLNGRGWQLLDSNAKKLYMTAFNEGNGLAIINWLVTGKPKPTNEEFNRQESFYTSDGAFTVIDTCDQIDKFYTVQGNLDIPVAYAALFVNAKFRGATPQELEAYNNRLKKMIAEKTGHMPPPLKVR
jgi:hypothetical protein